MISLSKRGFYASVSLAALGTAAGSILFPETVVAELASPLSLSLVLVVPGVLAYLGLTGSGVVDVRALLYGAGLSAVLLMILGSTINLLHHARIDPIRPVPVWLSFGGLLAVLGYWSWARIPGDTLGVTAPTSVRPYLLGALPIAAGVGALLVERGGPNAFVLLALGAILAIYLVGVFDSTHRPVLLYAVALALLLHNTLGSEFLLWGDQGKEANLAYQVLLAGHWDPATLPRANKAVMLRIVILHPMHALLSGLDLRHVFKIAHPLLFATAPVALYHAFATRRRPQAGYVAAGALMFFFPFFTVLSRNTRTAVAVLFVILFLHALLDTEIAPRVRRVLLPVFGTSVFLSHYGTGYMFLAMLGGGVVIAYAGRKLFAQQDRFGEHLPIGSVALIGLGSFAWYTYVPPRAATLRTLVSFVVEFTRRLREGFFQPSNSATANYAATSFSSVSLTGIKILTVVLFALIALGWLVAVTRAWRGETGIETNVSFLSLATVAGALAAITFLPVERFNTARTVAVSLAVVAPLFAIGVEGLLGPISDISVSRRRLTVVVCLLVLVPLFVFSTGLLAATVTHDYSPNVLVYRDAVTQDGSPASNSYLHKQHLPDTGARAGAWLDRHGTGVVYGSRWPGNPTPGTIERNPTPAFEYRANVSAAAPDSCVYLSPLSVDAGVVRMPSGHFENDFLRTADLDTTTRSRVYANGGALLYC